jgi:hypothetical protein
MSSFSCRWVYMSLASLALRTALLHVVPQLPLALGVACPWTLLTFAGCASALAILQLSLVLLHDLPQLPLVLLHDLPQLSLVYYMIASATARLIT